MTQQPKSRHFASRVLIIKRMLSADFLKIDRSFVSGLGRDPEDKGLVSSMINLAHSLSLEVIAEGVETEEQVAYLLDTGCELGQGYYFWEPVSDKTASELLAAWPR